MFPLVGKTTAMCGVFKTIERAARVESPVLIWGEKGTGKRLISEIIHYNSHRSKDALIVVSTEELSSFIVEQAMCDADHRSAPSFSDNGHTRLDSDREGTLLIEEITELPKTTQARLLRMLEDQGGKKCGERERSSLGGVRLIVNTCHDPRQSIEEGTLREDLYYRLAVVGIRVPPLRERKEDIPRLVRYVLDELCAASGGAAPSVGPELMGWLVERPWPGNIDELREVLEHMVSTHDTDTLELRHISSYRESGGARPIDVTPQKRPNTTLAEMERKAMLRALDNHQGNRTQAARSLGISVRTLQRKLKQWKT